jgi:hypothetical protein
VPNPANPQSLNRYSYCFNNPLKYTDPTGHDIFTIPDNYDAYLDDVHGGDMRTYTEWNRGNQGSNNLPLHGDSIGDVLKSAFLSIINLPNTSCPQLEPNLKNRLQKDETNRLNASKVFGPLSWYDILDGFFLIGSMSGGVPNSEGLINEFSRIPKPAGLGSSIEAGLSHAPRTLNEELAIQQAASNPMAGITLKGVSMTDSRWPSSAGWEKKALNVNGVEVHYTYNPSTGAFDDLKIIGK